MADAPPTPLLIRSPNWLGDAVMTFPAVFNLKKHLGDGKITVASPENVASLWNHCPFVDDVLVLMQPKKLGPTVEQIKRGNFASALLFPNSLRVAMEARLAGIQRIIGYAGRGRELLGIETVARRDLNFKKLHQKYDWLRLVAACGASEEEPTEPLSLRMENTDRSGPAPIIICPGAEYGPAKRWPEDSYAILAQHLLSNYALPIVFMGSKRDAELGARLAHRVPGSLNMCGETSLDEFMFRLARARLVICNDSGSMHLAAVLKVPTIAIFGSTEPRLTGPISSSVRILRHHVPCSPCFLRECPLDFRCMTAITPHEVLQNCENLLQQSSQSMFKAPSK